MHKVTGGTDLAGGAITTYGFIRRPQPGWDYVIDPRHQGADTIAYNLKESIPLVGKDPNLAGNRATVATGLVVAGGGRVLRWLIKAPVLKLGTHRVRLWGAGSGR